MKDKNKPKYNIAQNVGWMVKIAWKDRKRVLVLCILMAALEIFYNLTQLYIAPEILGRVEQHVPLTELLGTIGFFTLALFLAMGLKDYFQQIAMFPRVDVRSYIIGMIGRKCNMTSLRDWQWMSMAIRLTNTKKSHCVMAAMDMIIFVSVMI